MQPVKWCRKAQLCLWSQGLSLIVQTKSWFLVWLRELRDLSGGFTYSTNVCKPEAMWMWSRGTVPPHCYALATWEPWEHPLGWDQSGWQSLGLYEILLWERRLCSALESKPERSFCLRSHTSQFHPVSIGLGPVNCWTNISRNEPVLSKKDQERESSISFLNTLFLWLIALIAKICARFPMQI